jgi:trbC/VIRB2 family
MGNMTMKRIAKICTVLIIIATIATMMSTVFAEGASDVLGKLTGNTDAASAVTTTANNIVGIVQVICYATAVIMLIYLGVKFITASPEAKADIKKSAIMYVIGAIIVFAAGTLLGVISNLSTNVVKTQG